MTPESSFPTITRCPLPLPPSKPAPADCCGHDCAVCVFDLYEQELSIWERECERLNREAQHDDKCRERTSSPALETEIYRDFKIINASNLTRDVIEIQVKPVQLSIHPVAIELGQHVIVRCTDTSNGADANPASFSRQLTPIDADGEQTFKLMIKLKPGGRLSSVASKWTVGDNVALRGPFSGLNYRKNQCEKIWIVAMGVGIAPLLSYISKILDDEEDETEISLLYACRFYDDICHKPKLDAWTAFWNFRVTYYLSGETDETLSDKKRYAEIVVTSRLNPDKIIEAIIGETNGRSTTTDAVFIVGSPQFEIDSGEAIQKVFHGKIIRFTSL